MLTRTSHRPILAALLLLLIPTTAQANAGTPLMWATMLHLVIGNAIIGVLEGLLVARILKCRRRTAIGAMIAANYISAWVGGLGLMFAFQLLPPVALGYAMFVPVAGIAATYIATVFLEWPFVWSCIDKAVENRKKRALWISALVQALSYALIVVPWFSLASDNSLITETEIEDSTDFVENKEAQVYFISEDDGDVYRLKLGGGQPERFAALGSTGDRDRLAFQETEAGDCCDLVAVIERVYPAPARTVLLEEAFSPRAALTRQSEDDQRFGRKGIPLDYGRAIELRPEPEREWAVWASFMSMQGLLFFNEKTEKRHRLTVNSPFQSWLFRTATVLPGDEIVFQVASQICVYSRRTNKLALVTRGRGPLVVLPPAAPGAVDDLAKK